MLEQIEPYGERGAYWRAAVQASLFLNAHRKKGARRVFTPEDLMPNFYGDGTADTEVTLDAIEARIAAAAAHPRAQRTPNRS